MRFFLACILLIVTITTVGQKSCEQAKKIKASELSNQKLSGETSYFLIEQDSAFKSIVPKGDFKKITVFKGVKCNSLTTVTQLDERGVYFPTPAQIDEGYCYCDDCIRKLSKIRLNDDGPTLIKIDGGKSIKGDLVTFSAKKPKEWYEKEYKKGDKIQLTDIMFQPGVALFKRSSYKDLEKLFVLMDAQKNLKIEIQGHVNGPNKPNKKEFQQLSNKRALAVLNYLKEKGIDENRLSSKGYGNTKMVFPEAQSEFQMQFNRRVEILVL